MPKTKTPSRKPPKRSSGSGVTGAPPPNKVHEYREELGLNKTELAKLASLTDKTIARVERQKLTFRTTTYYRILNAINKARRSTGLPDLTFKDVFPPTPVVPVKPLGAAGFSSQEAAQKLDS